ncbi:MAG: hypothetical protein ABUL49_02105, partial [bacterium]
NCRDCPRYDPEARTCRDGKINPATWETAVEASQVYGLRAICILNDHRERLVMNRGFQSGPSQRRPQR